LDYAKYATDFAPGHGEREVDRGRLLAALRNYLAANNLSVDWERIESASNERLVNTLSILSPYGGEEKQALLEAPDLKSRGRALVALAEMELAARDDGSGTQVQ
jgi:Lon protease-like protein